mgnify:FL=1
MNWLHSFEAAARLGNMTLAASEVGLTQAAMSQQIKALEMRLGRQLFIREPRGVSLTAAGSRLYSDIAPGLEQIGRALNRYSTPGVKRLRILCNISLAMRWLIHRLPEFQQTHPDILLEMQTAMWRPDKFGYDADVELFLGTASAPARAELLAPSPIIAVAAPEYASACPSSRAKISLIKVSGLDGTFNEWAAAQKAQKRSVVEAVEIDGFHMALELAQAGLGVTLCPSFLARDAVREGRLIALPHRDDQFQRSYWLQLKDGASPSALAFKEWATAAANDS